MNPIRATAAAAALLLLAALSPSAAQSVTEINLSDAALGRPNAPVPVIEYSSLGCSHCAAFHATVLPRLKTNYIDTCKVRWTVRDFPLGQLALAGAVVARCAGPQGYLALLDALFHTQESWMTNADPIGALEKVARQAGLDKKRFDACLDDRKLVDGLVTRAREVEKTVSGTPTFLINGERVVGMMPYEDFAAVLERHLKTAQSK